MLASLAGRLVRRLGTLRPSSSTPLLRMIRRDIAEVPSPQSPPKGYDVGFGGPPAELANLLAMGDEFPGATARSVEEEALRHALPCGDVRVYFQGRLVAAAAACLLAGDQPAATLMNVIVDRRHRRKGLGAYVVGMALRAASTAGCPAMVLRTQTHREEAILLYRGFGFGRTVHSDLPCKSRE